MLTKKQMIDRSEWAEHERLWQGEFEGSTFGAGLSVMFFSTETPGRGPRLHSHPYDEIFIIRSGSAEFVVGDQTFTVQAGQVVFGPANVPHKYVSVGPDLLEMIDIHASGTLSKPISNEPLEQRTPSFFHICFEESVN